MSASAGRVLLMPKGDYDTTVTYKPLDIVKYGVSSYVCILQTQGNVPTNATYWQVLAEGIANVTPEELGIGYGIASGSGTDRTATLADYELVTNGIVAVTFAVDVPANATLNINSQGAKAIYYRGSALVANVIRGGDTVTFAYDGTRYNVLCIDGGAGHEIENSAGTKLTQRDVMQVTDGLEAVDDSTNQKTKIKMNLPTISLADWNAMTEQEQTAYKASHYRFGVELPDTEGVINAEYMTLLWENPNTTQAFTAQSITLSSADFDFLLVLANGSTANPVKVSSITNGNGGILSQVATMSGTAVSIRERGFTFSGTTVSFLDATVQNSGSSSSINNNQLIPIAIYGIKKNVQFKVNAIASNLSTRADHCFLDDETTTVEDALTYKDVYSTDEHVVGKWIDGSTLYEKTINFGAMPNNTTKSVTHSIANISNIISITGSCNNGTYYHPLSQEYITATLYATKTAVAIRTTTDMSAYTAYATIRYTKTS